VTAGYVGLSCACSASRITWSKRSYRRTLATAQQTTAVMRSLNIIAIPATSSKRPSSMPPEECPRSGSGAEGLASLPAQNGAQPEQQSAGHKESGCPQQFARGAFLLASRQ
jgi:hypothetical protein